MFQWKDFFYYSRSNRIGIILLLILIAIAGIFYVALHKFVPVDPSYALQTEEMESDFASFEDNLITTSEVVDNEDIQPQTTKTSKTKAEKLKAGQTIDLNHVSSETLTRIPGIGEIFAKRIIEYRNALGGFVSLDQLREIKGISMSKYSKILPYIVLKKAHRTFDLNQPDPSHPYLNDDQIESIKSISNNKRIQSLEDLTESEHFTAKDIDRLKPYIRFE